MKTGNCRCEACGQMFYSLTAFEMHRTDSYTRRHSRHCLSTKEMRAKGMQRSQKGVWNSGQFSRRIKQMEIWPSPEKVSA